MLTRMDNLEAYASSELASGGKRGPGRPKLAVKKKQKSLALTNATWEALEKLSRARSYKDDRKVTSSELARDAIVGLLENSGFSGLR